MLPFLHNSMLASSRLKTPSSPNIDPEQRKVRFDSDFYIVQSDASRSEGLS